MDPITTAIIAAVGKLAEPAVKDAYEGLKKLLARKFTSVKEAVDHVEQEPASKGRKVVLEEQVAKATATEDEELKQAVEKLLKALGTPAAPGVSVTQNVTGNQNIFSGTGSVKVKQK